MLWKKNLNKVLNHGRQYKEKTITQEEIRKLQFSTCFLPFILDVINSVLVIVIVQPMKNSTYTWNIIFQVQAAKAYYYYYQHYVNNLWEIMKKHLILEGNLKNFLSSLGYKNFKVIRKNKKCFRIKRWKNETSDP